MGAQRLGFYVWEASLSSQLSDDRLVDSNGWVCYDARNYSVEAKDDSLCERSSARRQQEQVEEARPRVWLGLLVRAKRNNRERLSQTGKAAFFVGRN
jgi:hypothetical protein